jgi:hypothetical protein
MAAAAELVPARPKPWFFLEAGSRKTKSYGAGVLSPAPRGNGQSLTSAGELFQWVAKVRGDPRARRSDRRGLGDGGGSSPHCNPADPGTGGHSAEPPRSPPSRGWELLVATAWVVLLHSEIAGTRSGTRNPKGSE